MHQSAFLNALVKETDCDVTLIVTEKLSRARITMGWKEPILERVTVLRIEDSFNWKAIIDVNNNTSSIHVFSGINAFPKVHKAFKYAILKKCRIGILSEPLNHTGFKGSLRMIKGAINRILYGKHVSFLLAIGDLAVQQYLAWGYSENKIFPWAYTVEKKEVCYPSSFSPGPFKIMFAGSLILRKGYDLLINAFKCLNEIEFNADFYCVSSLNTSDAREIMEESSLNGKLRMLPFLSNEEICQKMTEYDLLVLPSRFDGWGAVVSESLMAGTPALVSKYCGVSTLIKNHPDLGRVIKEYSSEGIALELRKLISAGKIGVSERLKIRSLYEEKVSGHVMAIYFSRIISHLNNSRHIKKPHAPWLQEITI